MKSIKLILPVLFICFCTQFSWAQLPENYNVSIKTEHETFDRYNIRIISAQFDERIERIGPDYARKVEEKYESLGYILDLVIDEQNKTAHFDIEKGADTKILLSIFKDFNLKIARIQ